MRASDWELVWINEEQHIAFIEDMDRGGMSVTNDAEMVYWTVRQQYGSQGVKRVVYKDTEGEWWEIGAKASEPGKFDIYFEKWHGVMWDKLRGNVY